MRNIAGCMVVLIGIAQRGVIYTARVLLKGVRRIFMLSYGRRFGI